MPLMPLPINPVQYYWIYNVGTSTTSGGTMYLKSPDSYNGTQLVQTSVYTALPLNDLTTQWGFVSVGSGQYQIFNAGTGLCVTLALDGLTPSNGNPIQQCQWVPGRQSQQWQIQVQSSTTGSFTATFTSPLSANNTSYCWDILNDSTQSGTGIHVWQGSSSQTSQQWVVTPVSSVATVTQSRVSNQQTVYLNYLGWCFSTDGSTWQPLLGDILIDSTSTSTSSVSVQVVNSSVGPVAVSVTNNNANPTTSSSQTIASIGSSTFTCTVPSTTPGTYSWGISADPTFKITTTAGGQTARED